MQELLGFMRDFYDFESGLENVAQAVEFSMSDPVPIKIRLSLPTARK